MKTKMYLKLQQMVMKTHHWSTYTFIDGAYFNQSIPGEFQVPVCQKLQIVYI